MLDLLIDPQKAKNSPLSVIALAIFYSSISILLGLWIFEEGTSLAIIFLSSISCIYLFQRTLKSEERKEKNFRSEGWMLKQHESIFILVLSLFIGFLISFSLWSFFLSEPIADDVFELQKISLDQIKQITGNATNLSSPLMKIFTNNLNIILISLIFAIFFGAGVIYIIVWNASVMGLVIGSTAKEASNIFYIPLQMFKFSIHGLPEMLAYIVAAVAGGILYFALIRGDLTKSQRNKRIFIDILTLIGISILLLVIAALLEVFVTPLV